jgi:hypothetical protein
MFCHSGTTSFICFMLRKVGLLPMGAMVSASSLLMLPPGTNLPTMGMLSSCQAADEAAGDPHPEAIRTRPTMLAADIQQIISL